MFCWMKIETPLSKAGKGPAMAFRQICRPPHTFQHPLTALTLSPKTCRTSLARSTEPAGRPPSQLVCQQPAIRDEAMALSRQKVDNSPSLASVRLWSAAQAVSLHASPGDVSVSLQVARMLPSAGRSYVKFVRVCLYLIFV